MLSYSLPLYKMYRGGLSHKPNSNYWSTGGSNSAEFDQFVWSDLFVQITKNAEFSFVPSVQTRLNQSQAPKLFAQVLDKESTPFIKNQIVSLPSPHEEFDINYVYQYWAPEINTTRRSDHASRFRVTWSPFFSLQGSGHLDSSRMVTNIATGSDAITLQNSGDFLKTPTQTLIKNDIYLANVSRVASHTNIAGVVSVFKPLEIERLLNSEAYYFNTSRLGFHQHNTEAVQALVSLFSSESNTACPGVVSNPATTLFGSEYLFDFGGLQCAGTSALLRNVGAVFSFVPFYANDYSTSK